MPMDVRLDDPRAEFNRLRERLLANPEGYEENRDLALHLAGMRNFTVRAEPFILKALS